ncbi:MAG: glycosyltransferase family 4 protein [Actinomycetes bacterium]
MRVLLDVSAVPARPVGAGVYTIQIARRLAEHAEVDLVLVTRVDDADRWAALAPGAELLPEVPTRRPARLLWEQRRAPGLARRIGADLWHGPHYTMPLRIEVPSVITIHDLTFFDHPEWHERSKVVFFQRMIRAAARRANGLICVSDHTARRLEAVVHPSAPVTVAAHGVDHARFTPEGDADADRRILASTGVAEPYVAFVGTIEPRKDVPSLVRAFASLSDAHPELRLVLAGADGWGADAVRDAIATSGCTTRILRPGYIPAEALAPLLRRAAAVAYPSLEEGFGLPALEALACGSPVVTTSGSAMADVCGDAARLVPPGRPDLLATALAAVLDDPTEARRLRAAGPVRAAGFTWARAVDAHLCAYRLAVGPR